MKADFRKEVGLLHFQPSCTKHRGP
jgi:hypothetical protein